MVQGDESITNRTEFTELELRVLARYGVEPEAYPCTLGDINIGALPFRWRRRGEGGCTPWYSRLATLRRAVQYAIATGRL